MYATCLHCRQALGANDSFERFPVGKRLAYDPARGRLWVVCPHCARWNLSPLEERWETIDEAERRFEQSRLRAGTGEIALARLSEGTELVRIGKPPRLELAAWRYGDTFKRRRKRALVIGGAIAAAGLAAAGGAVAAGIGVGAAYNLGRLGYLAATNGRRDKVIARLRAPNGEVVRVRGHDLPVSRLARDAEGRLALDLDVSHTLLSSRHTVRFTGAQATHALAHVLPAVNRMGGTKDEIERAIARLDHAGSTDAFLASVARGADSLTPVTRTGIWRRTVGVNFRNGLRAMPPAVSLAIEMAVHEDQERAALEGDLIELEAAWREAEEIARIADDLLLPGAVTSRLEKLKRALG